MVSTFISLLDIQSWWEIPCIAHFCSLFSSAFDLPDIDIEDLESALLTDGTEDTVGLLPELIVRILRGCDSLKFNRDEITTSNYQMFLRRFLRHQCRENNVKNYFDTDTDFSSLSVRNKLLILHSLCHFRLESADVCYKFNNLEADSLRVEPLGFDSKNSGYWYFFGTRLYREDIKSNNNRDTIWQVVCFTEEDWQNLATKLKSCKTKKERALLKILEENFLPKLPQLFLEREKLRRKKLFQYRNSARIRATDIKYKDLHEKQDLERIEREKYEEQLKLAEVTNKKRRRSQSESTGSGISTYASSIRPSLNSSDFLCKREKFCLSPDLGASSLSPPPASLIHNNNLLFPPTPSQSPLPEKSSKAFNNLISESITQQNLLEIYKDPHSEITHIQQPVIEAKVFSEIINQNNSTLSDFYLREQRKLNFTPERYSKLDLKSSNSSNCYEHSDDYDDAISLVSFDEDKENLICYKRSDTESETESISYYCNSPPYNSGGGGGGVSARSITEPKLLSEENLVNMAPISNATAVKLPGRQTNNSLSSISENIFLPTFDINSNTKKNTKNSKSGKKDIRNETQKKSVKNEKIEKSGKKMKNLSNEKSEKKKEVLDVDSSHKKKKAKNNDSFTETDEVLQIGMHKVLVYVKNHRDAWPFMDPVEEDIAPRYYSIIRRPMDLLKMEDKLDNGEYKKFSEFRNDFKLIVNNCRLYNGQNNEYTEMVNNLQEAFDKATKKYFDNLSDEEDELGYPDSKLNVFREKYFNKTSSANDDDIEKILSASNIKVKEKDSKEQCGYNSVDTDEENVKIEGKGKITKRKRKDKDKRRKKKIKLEGEKCCQNDDTDEDEEEKEEIHNSNKEEEDEVEEKFQNKDSLSETEDLEDSLKNKNKKLKKLTETNRFKKKNDSKLKDKDKPKKQKDEHNEKDVKHKSKNKNSDKDKECSGKFHTKKGHNKTKSHKSFKEISKPYSDVESDIEPNDNENIEEITDIDKNNFQNRSDENIFDFGSNNSSDEDFNLEINSRNRKHEIKSYRKSEKISKKKGVKTNSIKTKEKVKPIKKCMNSTESRNSKRKHNIKKKEGNKKYLEHITQSNVESEAEDITEKTDIENDKKDVFRDSSRSPTPNFKVDLHKKYANTLTSTKSASLERRFSNDDKHDQLDETKDMKVDEDKQGNDDEHCNNKVNMKNTKKNSLKRTKDLNKKSCTKTQDFYKTCEEDINLTEEANNETKKIFSKNRKLMQSAMKSKKLVSSKSKKKSSKISEEKCVSKDDNKDNETEDVISNLNQSVRSRSQSPSYSDTNEKTSKHKNRFITHPIKLSETKKKRNHKVKSKNKKKVSATDAEVESSEKEDNDPEPEKEQNIDLPLFLDKYDLIKQRRRCAILTSKKSEDKIRKISKQIDKNKNKKETGRNRSQSIKGREKNQKNKETIVKLKVQGDKNKEHKAGLDEIHSGKNSPLELRNERGNVETLHDSSVGKSPIKQTERNFKKSQGDFGKIKNLKSQNTQNTDLKDSKNKECKSKEVKPLIMKEIDGLDSKVTNNNEVISSIHESSMLNKHSKKQQQILDSISTNLSNTANLINKKKGKNSLGIAPPVAIVAPTQSLTNTSLIKADGVANKTNMEALELETEQTLKDINRWLEHTPRFSEFSSASNSPNRYNLLDDFDAVAAKLDPADFRRPMDTINTSAPNRSTTSPAKADTESKLTDTFDEIKKSSDSKLITDLIPVTAVTSNKLNILGIKDSDSQNSTGSACTGTTGGANSSPSITSTIGSSLLPSGGKPKEPSSTQLLPHPPPPPPHIKNQLQKEAKRKSLKEKLTGAGRRKDLLRTIDRLQPGKSKGNLLTNIHNTNKQEELFPLGSVTKTKEVKNSLVVETDESAPKLSLGSVLNTSGFGLGQLHNFGDEIASGEFKISEAITSGDEKDIKKNEETSLEKLESDEKKVETGSSEKLSDEIPKEDKPFQAKKEEILPRNDPKPDDSKSTSATPNLSAWFKAFGAPKKTKKQEEEEEKKKQESMDSGNNIQHTSDHSPMVNTLQSPAQSVNDNFSLPAPRQRKASTGSTVSERSSYSQDPESPRIGIDDRFGPYPGPYTSPIGASPIMVSPKADEATKPTSPYPLNGTIKVGFYQDTTTKSSPEKSCSPRELPSPAYPQYSQHIYSATSPNVNATSDIISPAATPYGAGNSQINSSLSGSSSNCNSNTDQKKTPSSSGFSPRSPVQPPTPTLYEQYKQPHSQESDYNSSMSPSTNPNSPYQQPQSSPYQHNSSSPYHQSSNPNSPYQQPHSPFSNQTGQTGQGPPSSGPPSVGSMHIVTNSPNHPNGESPRDQNSPYQQQLNSPYQHSGHSSPYNQNPSSPYQQSSSPAHVSGSVSQSQQQQPQMQQNSQESNFAQTPIINLETATSILEEHQNKLQKSENENIYGTKQDYSEEKNIKSLVNHSHKILEQTHKPPAQAPSVQQSNLPQGQQNIIQSQQHPQAQSQTQQAAQKHSTQLLQPPQYHSTNHPQVANHSQGPRNQYEISTMITTPSQGGNQISSMSTNHVADSNSMTIDKTNLNLQQQYPRYAQYPILNSDKSGNQRTGYVNELSPQLAAKQNSVNMQQSAQQQQKQQNQQQHHQSLSQQQTINQQNIQQSSQHLLSQQLQNQSQSIKRNYPNESISTSINVNYSQQNSNESNAKNQKRDEKQHQTQQQTQQQQPLYDSATLNKHQQMFDGFLSSMAAGKNIGFNKPLDITSSKAYEVLNKAAVIGFPNPLMQAAAVAAMSNKDNLQQHQTLNINQQQKNENVTNLYPQSLTHVNNNSRNTLQQQQQSQHQPQQQQQQQPQHHQTQRSQQQQQLSQQQQTSLNQQSSVGSLYGATKTSQANMASANLSYASHNLGQRNDNNPSELMPNTMNRNLDLSNYKVPNSNYQNSSNILDHTMRHHSALVQMMDDPNMLGVQNNSTNTINNSSGSSYYDKSMPPAAHMFSKNLPQQLYTNSATLYGGRDQQNLPPPGNYVPQNNQTNSNLNSQVEQQISTSVPLSVEQKSIKRSKKKKGNEITNLSQNTIQNSGNNQPQPPANLQHQSQLQQQEQQQILTNTTQNTSNAPGNNITQNVTAAHQGFQLYAGLKTAAAVVAASSSVNQTVSSTSNNNATDSSAISLKTATAASMVPGSAFNFGPSPTGLPIPAGLYGDNSTYLEEFRNANPYYIPPSHHRVTPEATSNANQPGVPDKSQSSSINNGSAPTVAAAAAAAASPYHQFLTAAAAHPATQRSTYPFMNSPQLDPNSPLYSQYLRPDEFRARMMQNLSQSLLPGAASGYPQSGYRPPLGMPKPYDMNNRQPWF